MSQGFNPAQPNFQSAMDSSVLRMNFNALDSCHSGEDAPLSPVEARWWFKPSVREMRLYTMGAYRLVFTMDLSGYPYFNDPRIQELFLTTAGTEPGSSTVIEYNDDGDIFRITEVILDGLIKTTTIYYLPDGSTSSVVTEIPSVGFTRTETPVYDASSNLISVGVS